MAPDQELESGTASPERPESPQPRRRGRRGGRGRGGRRQQPSLPPAQEAPPASEAGAETTPPAAEPAPAERKTTQHLSLKFDGKQHVAEPVHAEGAAPPLPARERQPAPPAAVAQAIEEVNHIIETLRGALEDMEEVLETLELAERQKNADEQEIETLRRGLRQLHRPKEPAPHSPRH